MSKKSVVIIVSILLIGLVIVGLYGTFAASSTVNGGDNVYNITLTESGSEVSVPAGESKTVIYKITNTNKGTVKYGLAFAGDNIEVKVYDDSKDKVTGNIDYGETKFIKLLITNTGSSASTASVKSVLGYKNGGELSGSNIVPSGHTMVTEVYSNKPINLVEHIISLYVNGTPTVGTNTNVSTYYQSYQDEEQTWGLMNDGYDGVTKVTDTSALTSGTKGNIRYYGANPNNYILFNCDDYSKQSTSTCEIWRIIGIVDGKVKIARATVLASTMAWNSAGRNNWENASLKTYLNGDYYESLQAKNTDTVKLISYSTWYLGGYSTANKLYADDIYGYERKESTETIYTGNLPSIEANIGLMYASDYSYATDLSVCAKDIYNYDTDVTNCREKDWLLKSGVETQINTYQWLITPRSSHYYGAWIVYSPGYVHDNGDVANEGGVRAVLYLNSELAIESGHEGTNIDPYRISVS